MVRALPESERPVQTLRIAIAGVVLALLGFFLAAPIGHSSPDNSNPRVLFAPGVFVIGVIVMFSSAVVYELYGGGREG